MTTDELKAAAERLLACDGELEWKEQYEGSENHDFNDDVDDVAKCFLARLAADEQQAKVDAEPIGREWFNENGNDVSSIIVCRDNIEYEIEAACGNPSIGIDLTVNDRYACKIIHIPHVTTRGQLRKLLEALKGGA